MRIQITRVLLGTAFVSLAVLAGPATPDLGQGWNDQQRDFYWYTNQGSWLVPRDWLLALEREDSQDLFLADSLTRFGYLAPNAVSARNPDKLPVGFAVDPATSRNKAWIGMTCAACHVSELTRAGVTLRIDGAPGDADMYAFLAALDQALSKTANDDAAFDRFAIRVLGPGSSPQARQQLRDGPDGLRPWAGRFSVFVQQSKANTTWGPRRLDAFGMIFNRVTSIDLGIRANSQPPDAPVSYPFLWGTSWHDFTQWTGAVHNEPELARLARNVGQVLGVFGTLDFGDPGHIIGYPTSANVPNLLQLEATLSQLKAPEWPSALFGVPAPQRLANGERLYSNNCSGCHHPVPRDNQLRPATVTRVPLARVGTDELTARLAAERTAQTGMLKGRRIDPLKFETFGETALAANILNHAVIGALAGGVVEDADAALRDLGIAPSAVTALAALPRPRLRVSAQAMFASPVPDLTYKARPLNGIWATSPYLHNGSVRTLRQLLLPPAQREQTFLVGSREFDPTEVGFLSAGAAGAAQPFLFDTRIPGNSNKGHVFGTGLSDADKGDLLEYLKQL